MSILTAKWVHAEILHIHMSKLRALQQNVQKQKVPGIPVIGCTIISVICRVKGTSCIMQQHHIWLCCWRALWDCAVSWGLYRLRLFFHKTQWRMQFTASCSASRNLANSIYMCLPCNKNSDVGFHCYYGLKYTVGPMHPWDQYSLIHLSTVWKY